MLIIPLLMVGGFVAYKIIAPTEDKTSAVVDSDDGIPRVSSLEVNSWAQGDKWPADKLNNRGEKFIDPYAIEGACMKNPGGIEYLIATPKNGKARITAIHTRAQTTPVKVMPAADVLVNAAGALGANAMKGLEKDLKLRQKWWGDQMKKYAYYSGNGYAIAFAEIAAWLLKIMPASWAPEYKRASELSANAADELSSGIQNALGFGLPFPLHFLDGSINNLNTLQVKAQIINVNNKKFLSLPDSAKKMLVSWFSLLSTSIGTDREVQAAVNYCDNNNWGAQNLASDELVYLVGTVFAKSIGHDPVEFSIKLWDAAAGWNHFPQLLTNSHVIYGKTANGGAAAMANKSNSGFVWDQPLVGGWAAQTKSESGMEWGSNCAVTNARMITMFDLVLTGWQMVAAAKGLPPAIKTSKLIAVKMF